LAASRSIRQPKAWCAVDPTCDGINDGIANKASAGDIALTLLDRSSHRQLSAVSPGAYNTRTSRSLKQTKRADVSLKRR
jgi:hypothetical protein